MTTTAPSAAAAPANPWVFTSSTSPTLTLPDKRGGDLFVRPSPVYRGRLEGGRTVAGPERCRACHVPLPTLPGERGGGPGTCPSPVYRGRLEGGRTVARP